MPVSSRPATAARAVLVDHTLSPRSYSEALARSMASSMVLNFGSGARCNRGGDLADVVFLLVPEVIG
jgi:hypothetical protein